MALNQPRFIGSASPFKQWAEKYFKSGFNPIPLPPGKKNPPPTGFTGQGRPMVDWPQLGRWMDGSDKLYWYNEAKKKSEPYPIEKANIALRLNTIELEDGTKWDIVGIDVDHHPDDVNDPKDGGTQLDYLEKKFGPLPDTWTSSARVNGIAGIRFYRAPTGLMWRGDCGKAGPDIDIISKNYRFAVCFPSTNPDADNRQYWWYPPGFKPDGNLDAIDRQRHGLIPDPKELPLLPDSWVDFLTQNRIKDIGVPMDMDSTAKQLTRWATKNFAPNKSICEYMVITLDKWKTKLDDSAKSHNILTDAHYHILKCGAEEGHTGWGKTVGEFEKYYISSVLARDKRTVRAAEKEVERSRYGALRRIKGSADEASKNGVNYFGTEDACDVFDKGVGEIKSDDPPVTGNWPYTIEKAFGPGKYTPNDDGNALHFLDLHDGHVRYIPNVVQKWMIWDNERWVIDQSDVIARFLYRRVAVRQLSFAHELTEAYKKVAGAQGSAELRKLMNQWVSHANNSGNIANIRRALESAQSVREGVSVRFEELDKDRHSLGCSNGVVRVTDSGEIEVIDNAKELLITKNTGLPYIPLKQQKSEGKRLFKEFLDKFIAPSIDINYFQKLCGSTVLGGNREKMSIFFWGKTDTCKSTMLQLMVNSLGDYAGFRNPDIFKSTHLNPALAQALSLRIMAVSELGDNEINSELFKNITGGERITVELKGSNNLVSDIPQFTPIITTNGVPRVPGEDTAFRNRLRVIEFQHQATEQDKLSGNQEKLYALGGEAVLAWLIEGAAKYVKEGLLPVPVEILMATDEFTSKLSDLADFAQTNLVEAEGEFVRGEDIFFRFKQWADHNNFNQKGWGRTRLTQKLKALGFKDYRKMIKDESGRKELARGFINVKLSGGEIEHSNTDS